MRHIDLRTLTDKTEIVLPGGIRLILIPPTSHTHVTIRYDTLCDLFEQFHAEQKTVANKRATTLTGYRRHWSQFRKWLSDHGVSSISDDHWKQYYASIRNRNLSPYTVRNHYRDLSVFIHWLIDNQHLTRNPLDNIVLPKPPKHSPPKAIADDDVREMLQYAESLRDKTLLMFFLDTGCRIGEAAALTWGDIDISAHTAHVIDGKWHQSRWLFFSDVTANLLEQYSETVPHTTSDPLWSGKKGGLTSSGIYQIFRRAASNAGVSGHANPHAWRHAFGKHATISGMPTATLQQLLGHSSVETTQIYVALDTAELQNAHEQHTPVRDIVDQSNKTE